MEKFTYIQEGGTNYLKSDRVSACDYISAMLIHNDIPGIVSASFRSLNSESYVCYNMNSLIPISQSLEITKFNGDRAEEFLRSFISVYKSMEEFLLPLERLVASKDYIYEHYGKKEGFFWICGNERYTGKLSELFEELLDKLDYKDDKAVKIFYALYQTAKESEDLSVGNEALSYVTGLTRVKERAEEILSAPYNSLDADAIKRMEDENRREYREEFVSFTENRDIPQREEKEEFIEKYKKLKKNEKIGKYEKTEKYALPDFKNKLKKFWKYLCSDIGSKEQTVDERFEVCEKEQAYNVRESAYKKTAPKEENDYNPTMLLTGAMTGGGIYCLSPEDRNCSNILLTEYPFFIGKAENNIHFKIEDSTVSRYHARIDRVEEEFFITDLGSTNGTFLNGIRLMPFDRVKISIGDFTVISRKRYEFKYLS